MRYIKLLYIVLIAAMFTACEDNRIYDSHLDIKNGFWNETEALTFDFEIKEKKPYAVIYNIRYSNTYPYYNLYVHYYLTDSAGKSISDHLQRMDLFTPTSGEPLGKGLGDLYDRRILAIPHFTFPYPGKYKMKVKQYMRQSQLPGIASFGLSIETIAD
jgi:gliding motility-associated lipoprotein GldH